MRWFAAAAYSGHVVSRAWAVQVVEQYLAALPAPTFYAPALVVTGAREHRLGWLVFCQGERYVRTGALSDMLIGQGCFLVDALDASLHQLPSGVSLHDDFWTARYLEDVRGVEQVQPVDPLQARIAELLHEGSRLEAIKAVRAAIPGLVPADAKRYVDAVADRAPLPEDIVTRTPRAERPRPGHITLTAPNPEPRAPSPGHRHVHCTVTSPARASICIGPVSRTHTISDSLRWCPRR